MAGMSIHKIEDVERLKRINEVLVNRVERAMDQQQNAFSLFQTAIFLEGQVRQRTDELSATLRSLELSNVELAQQKEISERANLSKTRFLAAASHDVLQPLHAAQLVVSTLADIQETEQGGRLVSQVERSLDTMHELLQTLLDISRLDAGVVKTNFESVPLVPVMDSLVSDFRPIAEEKGLRLRMRTANLHVWSDRKMLRRVLQNLISNAIRYTPKGGVLVGTRKRGEDVVIEVVDTGCGISVDQQDHVFEEFHRGTLPDGADANTRAGLGLGLAIVKRLVTALQHDLSFTSKPGSGTRFSLFARQAEARKDHSRPVNVGVRPGAPEGLAGTRVLLVENEPSVVEAMFELLALWGCETRTGNATEEALIQLRDWNPDLIIADQHLDRGDLGTDAISLVHSTLGQRIPAIVITADPGDVVVESSAIVGAEVMHKPIKPAQLRALIYHLLVEAELEETPLKEI